MRTHRWILAFDGACGACQEAAQAVHRAGAGRLEVLPLTDTQVRQWRATSLGEQASWAPTLLVVDNEKVRGRTGPAMALPLARRLGPRPTLRVLAALGRLHFRTRRHGTRRGAGTLLQVATGLGIVAGMLLKGDTPSFADSPGARARAWVQANRERLPDTYDELVQHRIEYRRAIYAASPVAVRRHLWLEHLERFHREHPDLSEEQSAVVDRARTLLTNEDNFTNSRSPEVEQRFDEVGEAAVQAFGEQQAYALLAFLGPESDLEQIRVLGQDEPHAQAECTCNTRDEWCGWGGYCSYGGCTSTADGCGWGWEKVCNGLCR